MNKAILTKSPLAVLLVLSSFTAVSDEHDGSSTCVCAAGIKADSSLPLSHPVNRCAIKESKGVSWYSWFSGNSQSSQFHYLDLLELLTRSSDSKPIVDSSNTNQLGD